MGKRVIGFRGWARTIGLAVVLGSLMTHPVLASETGWPSRTVRMVVGFSPGSGSDVVARLLALKLGERLGQSVVVDNRPGAGGMLSTELVVNAPPDGYAILFVTGALTTSAALNPKLKFDVLRDLAPIVAVGRSEMALLVGPHTKLRTIDEFVKQAKAAPGKMTYGSSGVGGSTHFFMEQLSEVAGIKLTHVPYKGTGPATIGLAGGEIDALLSPLSVAPNDVAAGRAVALAVTGNKRANPLPEVPTFAQVGLEKFDASIFSGFVTSAKTPDAILERLNREINVVLKDPEVERRLVRDGGMTIVGGSRAQFASEIAQSLETMKRVARNAGIKAE